MRFNLVPLIAFLSSSICLAQYVTRAFNPAAIPIAPGQLITLLTPDNGTGPKTPVRASAPLPTSLAGVSIVVRSDRDQMASILEVRTIVTCYTGAPPPKGSCGSAIVVTAQIPFDIPVSCGACGVPTPPTSIGVLLNGVAVQFNSAAPLADQVHIMTICDVLVGGGLLTSQQDRLFCAPLVTHADGRRVTFDNPARGGEELVAYATGLGETAESLVGGRPASSASPTASVFALDFNYHSNALATKPMGAQLHFLEPAGIAPIFVGSTAGFIGLYQFNFVVPAPPPDLPPCVDASRDGFANTVVTNLTVSIGSVWSFDGAGICVASARS